MCALRSRYFSFFWFFEQRSCFDVIDFTFKGRCEFTHEFRVCVRHFDWHRHLCCFSCQKVYRTHTAESRAQLVGQTAVPLLRHMIPNSCPEMPQRCVRILWRANKVHRVPQLRTSERTHIRQIYSTFYCFSVSSLVFWPLLVFAHHMHSN